VNKSLDYHSTMPPSVEGCEPRENKPVRWSLDPAPAAAAGLLLIFAWRELQPQLINVVTYASSDIGALPYGTSSLVPIAAAGALLLLGLPGRARSAGLAERPPRQAWIGFGAVCAVCALSVLLVFKIGHRFLFVAALAVCAGWTVTCYSIRLSRPAWWTWVDRSAPLLLGAAIVSSTIWHAAEQFNLWQHLSLGYADFGFFITELEHCLPW
jgi:hypothetical protein